MPLCLCVSHPTNRSSAITQPPIGPSGFFKKFSPDASFVYIAFYAIQTSLPFLRDECPSLARSTLTDGKNLPAIPRERTKRIKFTRTAEAFRSMMEWLSESWHNAAVGQNGFPTAPNSTAWQRRESPASSPPSYFVTHHLSSQQPKGESCACMLIATLGFT